MKNIIGFIAIVLLCPLFIITWVILTVFCPELSSAQPTKKETIVKDGITYALKERSSIKDKCIKHVIVKGKNKKLVLENNQWVLKDKP